jgi:hypothetical protein
MIEGIHRAPAQCLFFTALLTTVLSALGGCTQEGESTYCGMPGSFSHPGNGGCDCAAGYVWENPNDPDNFTCVVPIAPQDCVSNCSNRACGPDPACGRSCGTCATGMCNEDGRCADEPCAKDCSGRRCGPDPVCGQSCGTCTSGTCNDDGQCSNAGIPCNLVTQQPCLAIEKCTVKGGDAAACTALPAIASSRDEGETCSYTATGDNCWRGLLCAQLNESETPKCHKLCDFDGAAGSSCTYGGASGCVFQLNSDAGLCSLPCDPFVNDCPPGGYCASLVVDNALLFTCLVTPDGGPLSLGAVCSQTEECAAGLICVSSGATARCSRLCDSSHSCGVGECVGMAASGSSAALTKGFCNQCYPDCGGQECGTDPVCGTTCGSCSGAAVCKNGSCCTPSCDGRQCGVDPVCGAACGTCSAGAVCTAAGTCCTPSCAGRECGVDPVCGISCGSCSGNETCSGAGQCACVPDCSGRSCGPDAKCGTSCGTCGGGNVCNNGSCCAPNCAGRQCGTDPICGTTCGFCNTNQYCSSNQCMACNPLYGSCSASSQCCQQAGVDIECQYGSCKQCAGSGIDCSTIGCCSGLFCNPAGMCNSRNCSELGMRCATKSDCCDSAVCDPDDGHRCQRCREQNYACTYTSQCCSGMTCRSGSCQP